MKVKRSLVLTIFLFVISLFFLNSCEMLDSSSSSEIPIYVTAGAYKDYYDEDEDLVFVNVMNSASVPTVKVNNQSLNRRTLEDDYFILGGLIYWDYFDFGTGQNLSLEIEYKNQDEENRTANASVTIPGSFSITSHPNSDVDEFEIVWGQDLTITWTQSTGAEAYEYYLWIEYETYNSTTDDWEYKTVNLQNMITGTSVTFSANELFPSSVNISEVIYTYGDFDIWACSKKMEEGDMGNITGDGIGFFNGYAWGDDLDFEVSGTSLAKRVENKSKDAKEKLLKIISKKCK